jgi:hypothetical protein
MSTFGKKALINWDYDSVDYLRWNKTPKDLQIEILKKWYPIGEYFYYHVPFDKKKIGGGLSVKIISYEEKIAGWFVAFKPQTDTKYFVEEENKKRPNCNPLRLKPSKEFLREIKLKQILKNE